MLQYTKTEIWPRRPRYFAAAVAVLCGRGTQARGDIHGEGQVKREGGDTSGEVNQGLLQYVSKAAK